MRCTSKTLRQDIKNPSHHDTPRHRFYVLLPHSNSPPLGGLLGGLFITVRTHLCVLNCVFLCVCVQVHPPSLPPLVVDPHLLHCVHRNAVSNAIKYGGRGQDVMSRVSHDGTTLTLEVISAPGPRHSELIKLSPTDAAAAVFAAGTR